MQEKEEGRYPNGIWQIATQGVIAPNSPIRALQSFNFSDWAAETESTGKTEVFVQPHRADIRS